MKPFKVLMISLMLAALLLVNIPAKVGANGGFVPPTAKIQGKTLAEWAGLDHKLINETPASQSPFLGNAPNCISRAFGNVLVMNGNWGAPINCTVPAGMFIVFSGMGVGCDNFEDVPFYGGNEAELHACLMQELFAFVNLKASIDGVPLMNPERYVLITPLLNVALPVDNFMGIPAGDYLVMAKSFTLMLAPLSVGKHTFYAYGEIPAFDFASEYTVNLTVVP